MSKSINLRTLYCRRPYLAIKIKHTFNRFSRVIAVNILSGSIHVYFCDFGQIRVVDSDSLRILPAHLRSIPQQAVKARLHGKKTSAFTLSFIASICIINVVFDSAQVFNQYTAIGAPRTPYDSSSWRSIKNSPVTFTTSRATSSARTKRLLIWCWLTFRLTRISWFTRYWWMRNGLFWLASNCVE